MVPLTEVRSTVLDYGDKLEKKLDAMVTGAESLVAGVVKKLSVLKFNCLGEFLHVPCRKFSSYEP
jgi:hypothetical protein